VTEPHAPGYTGDYGFSEQASGPYGVGKGQKMEGTGLNHIYEPLDVQRPDYSKGPSALDKAAHLFFFTEIMRG